MLKQNYKKNCEVCCNILPFNFSKGVNIFLKKLTISMSNKSRYICVDRCG